MGFFSRPKHNINQLPEGSYLVDVRTSEEYKNGHVPGSLSLPLGEESKITALIPDKDAEIFLVCLSGARSKKSAKILQNMGYAKAINIGNVAVWHGTFEEGM
ncbi:MAG: rhodanese-like domain-containing protein [Anaerovoracaceae bacterium]